MLGTVNRGNSAACLFFKKNHVGSVLVKKFPKYPKNQVNEVLQKFRPLMHYFLSGI